MRHRDFYLKRNVWSVSGIVLTERAKEYLKKVGSPNVSLSVKGGGCSGFQYEWGYR